jgi:CheY-like chemotaxis protein
MRVKILIADDDLEDLELIEDAILNAEPAAELHKFTNGLTAIDYLNTSNDNELPQLIVLDYNMPELNGAQLLASMNTQERYRDIAKVVVSTSNAPLHIQECMRNGAADYIVKPDNMQELYDLGEKLLTLCGRK